MADVQAKLEQEEIDQPEQEKANNTEEDNNTSAAEVAMINAEVGGQYDPIGGGSDMWELEGINEMEMVERHGVSGGGGWGEWMKHDDGGETWLEGDFSNAAVNSYQPENDWVIDDLWVFDDDHHQPNYNGDDAAANPRGPQA